MRHLLLTFLGLCLVSPSFAQQLSKEAVVRLAEQSKLPLHDRHIKAIANGETIPKTNYPKTVIKHIRGQKTNRFPTDAEIKNTLRRRFHISNNIGVNTPPKQKSDFLSIGTYQQTELPICNNTNTKKTIDSSNTRRYDILWLPEGAETPEDMEAAFGKDIIIIQSAKDAMDMSKDFNIKCLPSRIRASGDTIYKYEGAAAILNYDKSSEGELSAEMSKILKVE